jgi:hypothetical protein
MLSVIKTQIEIPKFHTMQSTILDDFDFEGNQLPIWAEEGEVVAKFFSPLEAEIAAARLRSEEIHCFLANSTAQSVLPHLQTVIRLHVRPQDSALAREILQEAAADAIEPYTGRSDSNGPIMILAIIIGVLLAFLLVRAMSFE